LREEREFLSLMRGACKSLRLTKANRESRLTSTIRTFCLGKTNKARTLTLVKITIN
jgi:hypothetical protein